MGAGSLSGCSFVNNTAQYAGGAFHYGSVGNDITVSDCAFAGNSAADLGGAYYAYCSGVGCETLNSVVSDCSFEGNSAGTGGAVYVNSGTTFSASTFVNHYAHVGGKTSLCVDF